MGKDGIYVLLALSLFLGEEAAFGAAAAESRPAGTCEVFVGENGVAVRWANLPVGEADICDSHGCSRVAVRNSVSYKNGPVPPGDIVVAIARQPTRHACVAIAPDRPEYWLLNLIQGLAGGVLGALVALVTAFLAIKLQANNARISRTAGWLEEVRRSLEAFEIDGKSPLQFPVVPELDAKGYRRLSVFRDAMRALLDQNEAVVLTSAERREVAARLRSKLRDAEGELLR